MAAPRPHASRGSHRTSHVARLASHVARRAARAPIGQPAQAASPACRCEPSIAALRRALGER
ncbi:hypothetical protein A8H32_21715 [Burkholderia thailandensis]|nr:hypothetical protein AQ475_25880 [Burkholderia thailandensis]AVR27641.1 hypothetical protein A8H32_21715 [Burkholderia thailandensis]